MAESELQHLSDRDLLMRIATLATAVAVLASKVDGHSQLHADIADRLRAAEISNAEMIRERETERRDRGALISILMLISALVGGFGDWVRHAFTGSGH